MPRAKLLFVVTVCISALINVNAQNVNAQNPQRSNEIKGMSGVVNVLPNANADKTTLAFTSSVPLTTSSSQIVFVFQASDSQVPPRWSGKARVFTGDGIVAVVPDDGSVTGWLYKFQDRGIPPSLSKMNFQVFNVFGIARYGEGTPLTEDQIQTLAVTGQCRTSASAASAGNAGVLADVSATPLTLDCEPNGNLCTSGGTGSSQCSAGGNGCSVTCNSGYAACCNANNNSCHCCKVTE